MVKGMEDMRFFKTLFKTRDERFNHGTRVKSPSGREGTVVDDYIPDNCSYEKFLRILVKCDDGEKEVRNPDNIKLI